MTAVALAAGVAAGAALGWSLGHPHQLRRRRDASTAGRAATPPAGTPSRPCTPPLRPATAAPTADRPDRNRRA